MQAQRPIASCVVQHGALGCRFIADSAEIDMAGPEDGLATTALVEFGAWKRALSRIME